MTPAISPSDRKKIEEKEIISVKKNIRWQILLVSGFFLLLDQSLKFLAMNGWSAIQPMSRFFGWQVYKNFGVAFSLPLSNWLIVTLSLPILMVVCWLLIISFREMRIYQLTSWSLILFGACSNLIDRITRGFVVDFFRFGMSLINLGDIMVLVGLFVFIWKGKSVNEVEDR